MLIIGLGVGLSNNNGSDEATVAAAASDNTATSNNGPAKETALFTNDDTASDNGAMDTNLFALEESVGDSALLNWPEVFRPLRQLCRPYLFPVHRLWYDLANKRTIQFV